MESGLLGFLDRCVRISVKLSSASKVRNVSGHAIYARSRSVRASAKSSAVFVGCGRAKSRHTSLQIDLRPAVTSFMEADIPWPRKPHFSAEKHLETVR